jgi:hypothetical protein
MKAAQMPKMSLADKLASGAYNNDAPYPVFISSQAAAFSKKQRHQIIEVYRNRQREINEEFHVDLAAEHGLTGHPKEQKLFDLAWSHGHSYGLAEVASYYEEFAELLK